MLHEVPADMAEAIAAESDVLPVWNGLTPIQRNEWICWTTSVKKPETRAAHIDRAIADLRAQRAEMVSRGVVTRSDSASAFSVTERSLSADGSHREYERA